MHSFRLLDFVARTALAVALLVGFGVATAPPAAAAVPGAPLSVTLAQYDPTYLEVSWKAPASTGGKAISAWAVTANPGNHTCWNTPTGTSRSCNINGLTSGVTYTVTVAAINADGNGPTTSSSPFVFNPSPPGSTVPGAPASVTLSQYGPVTLAVNWVAPASDGGAPIQLYFVTANPGNHTCMYGPASSTARTCLVDNLTPGVVYTVTVAAMNAVGLGPTTAADPFVLTVPGVATPPGAPLSVTTTLSGSSLDVSWVAPVVNGGPPISEYVVTADPGSYTCTFIPTGAHRYCPIHNLTPGGTYTATVAARNADGLGPSTAAAPVTIASITAPEPTPAPTLPPPPPSVQTPTLPAPDTETAPVNAAITVTPSAVSRVGTIVSGPTRPVARAGRPTSIAWRVSTTGGAPVADQHVVVHVRSWASKGAWRTYRTLLTDDRGYAVLRTTMFGDTEFRLRFGGSATNAASTGRAVVVRVDGAVTSKLTSRNVRRGARATVAGNVATRGGTCVVLLQQLVDRSWRTVASTPVGVSKRYSFVVPTAKRGRVIYRAVRAASPDLAAAAGPVLGLTVT
jgi:hypothetical protein